MSAKVNVAAWVMLGMLGEMGDVHSVVPTRTKPPKDPSNPIDQLAMSKAEAKRQRKLQKRKLHL